MPDTTQYSDTLIFFVNGKKVKDKNVDPEWTLLYYLRNKLRLTGTKLGCAEGGCGACTVMVSKIDRTVEPAEIQHLAVNACLAPVLSMHGLAVTTIEGLGSTTRGLHAVQERLAKSHGSQCGFCTPGIIMSMYALLRETANKKKKHEARPGFRDMEIALQGNLCRCTGYRAIVEGFKTFLIDCDEEFTKNNGINKNGVCEMGDKCCRNRGHKEEEDEKNDKLFEPLEFTPYDASQEPIFPPELQVSNELDLQYVLIQGPHVEWHRPTSLDELLQLKERHPDMKIIVGNTEVGVEVKARRTFYPILVQPTLITEMIQIETQESGVIVGAAVTLEKMESTFKNLISIMPENKTRIMRSIVEMLHYFAGKQIRNVAAIGGNIMTSSPISDLNPIFLSAGCILELQSKAKGIRYVEMNEEFFTGYRRNVVQPDEVLISIKIPFTNEKQSFVAYKQARRRDDDIAIVNAALNVQLATHSNEIISCRLSFGGMAPTTVMALKTCKFLIGREWSAETIELALDQLMAELPLDPGAPGGQVPYRRALTLSLFFKSYLTSLVQLGFQLPPEKLSGTKTLKTLRPESSQYFQIAPKDSKDTSKLWMPEVHKSAFKQATGEAIYCDDMPRFENELYLALVLSTRAHAKLLKIDATKALAMPGVHAFFSAKDLSPEQNQWGPVVHDEEIFISSKVLCFGQVIGAVVAENQATAQRATKLVEIEYEDLQPILISIKDAIAAKSFIPNSYRKMLIGDPKKAFNDCAYIAEGEVHMGGQEHFYLETHCTIAVPHREDDEMEIFISSQNPTETQKLIAEMLGVPLNRIVVRVKRMGGGFGGKESRFSLLALPCALAAHKLERPVRCMLDRDEDMTITGGRHPFYAKYRVGCTEEGRLHACTVQIYNNGGCSADLSMAVLERAIFHIENAYKIPNLFVEGQVCRTNLSSNTAFRGFGGPQGMFVAETMIRHLATIAKKPIIEMSSLNLYIEGDYTHYGQELIACTLKRCWDECIERSQVRKRLTDIEKFNKENQFRKRGLSIIPTKFGIAFTVKFLNQSGALLLVYQDGSILLTHGGTEMGQGLHTKMIQVASHALEVDASLIHISETSTDKVPNTSPTAASAGSDLNGMAVLNACEIIKGRLEPYRKANPDAGWTSWVKSAYFDRVSLSATGFYSTPDIGFDFKIGKGKPFNYFTYGAACTEVEIDSLTGDHMVLRTDIVMDLGSSLNPAIDIGQIEGGYIQGLGLYTLEEMIVGSNGMILSRGPGAYKIPGFSDIPAEFNVSLLKGAPNPRAVYSSKAVGEPPLFLAASVLFAIREAVSAARNKDQPGETNDWFVFDSPATSSAIRMAIEDKITKKILIETQENYKPWNIKP